MNWREHLRIVAILANVFLALFLMGTKMWWVSMGFGAPLIIAPILAIAALAATRNRRR